MIIAIVCGPAIADPTVEKVRTAQQALQSLGYKPGKADGIIGARTKSAFRKFQRKEGLQVTGELDQATMHALGFPDPVESATSPTPEPVSVDSNSGSGGGFLLFVVLAGAALVFGLVKLSKSTLPAPENTAWTTKSAQKVAPTYRRPVEQASVNAGMSVFASTAIQTASQLEENRPAPTAAGDLPLSEAITDRNIGDVTAQPDREKLPTSAPREPTLSAETARQIAEHNARVSASIIKRSSIASSELEAAAQADAKSMLPQVLQRTRLEIGSTDYFWIPASQAVTIGIFQIPSGMLYIGKRLRGQNGSVENCLIDPTLPVASDSPDTAGQTMPYWPSYSSISPHCRLAYLQWLTNGKRDPGACIGYVFLYFYGLERRLMLDSPGEEAGSLIAEVERLLSIYGDNHSFRGYATKLIEAAKFKFGGVPSSIAPVLGARGNELPLSIRAGVGHQLAAGKAIDADWMLAWYTASPERYLRTAATRCEKEFVALFRKRFAAKYPEGMKVSAPRRRLSYAYQAASATFSVALQGPLSDLPDIVALSAPLTAIDPIITSCMDDLAAYSRLIGRDPESRNTLRAAAFLPVDLDDKASAPMAQLSLFLEDLARTPAATVSLDVLLTKLDAKTTEKGRIPKSELVMISDALARCGFGIEPDPLSAGNALKGADKAVLFRAPAGARIDATKPSYMAARTLVDIGALVATADGVFSEDEVHAIEGEVVRDPDLSEPERIRLLAYLAFLSKSPPSARILTRFKGQPQEKRQALAQLAVSVAAADGHLATNEVRLLEKIYRVLGLADGALYSDLQSFAASDEALPTVAPADHEPSVAIPQPKSRDRAKGIRLDPARLARTRTDTAKVSEILADVFSDDAPQVVEETPTTAEPANDEGPTTACAGWDLSGLSAPYARLLRELKGRDSISRTDFVALAQKLNVLADGAIETINDWAIEKFDEPLIDEGDPIEIGFHLLVENKQDAA